MLGSHSPLKIAHYESLENRLSGAASYLGSYYRLAVIVRNTDYVEQPAIGAKLRTG